MESNTRRRLYLNGLSSVYALQVNARSPGLTSMVAGALTVCSTTAAALFSIAYSVVDEIVPLSVKVLCTFKRAQLGM